MALKTHTQNVIARNVTFEEYMENYAQYFAEWVDGDVIKMPPVTEEHDSLLRFLHILLSFYLDATGIGAIRIAPFVMRTTPRASGRGRTAIIPRGAGFERIGVAAGGRSN
jgi:Uma2 family endonuclease